MRPTSSPSFFTVFVVALGSLGGPRPANACSCAQTAQIVKSIPEDGAEGVPTDIVPWVLGGQAEIVDEDGAVVAAGYERRNASGPCLSVWELRPHEALAPQSRYTVRIVASELDPAGTKEISFTTGDGPSDAGPPQIPRVQVAVFDATDHLNTCVYSPLQACLRSTTPLLDIRYEREVGEDQPVPMHFVGDKEQWTNLELGEILGSRCLTIRARDFVGKLSEPLTYCFDAVGVPALDADIDHAGIFPDCDSQEVEALYVDPEGDDSEDEVEGTDVVAGCATVFPSKRAPWAWSLGSLGVLALFWRRRRGF